MTNEEAITYLRYRLDRIDELIPLQTDSDAADMLKAERHYVASVIDYRSKKGGLNAVVLGIPYGESDDDADA